MVPTSPPPIRVTVNDRILPVLALDERGRTLVPLRAIVEALGERVDAFVKHVPRGSRVVAGRTYVPVRAIAALAGASVGYDERARIVSVYAANTPSPAPTGTPAPATSGGLQPRDGSSIGTAYPTIAATLTLPENAAIRSLRVLVDGVDVTRDAYYSGGYVTYIPRTGLSQGLHSVDMSGVTTGGRTFHTAWSFTTTGSIAADVGGGESSIAQELRLDVSSWRIIGGQSLNVELIAPPGGRAYAFVCTSPWQYELYGGRSSAYYWGSVPTDNTDVAFRCPITAMYVSAGGAVTYAPYPVFVELLPYVPSYRRQPTPAPAATATPVPAATATPAPRPIARPTPVATAQPPERTPAPRRTLPPHVRKTPPPSTSSG